MTDALVTALLNASRYLADRHGVVVDLAELAIKARDAREPEKRAKEKLERKLMASIRRRWRRQQQRLEMVLGRLTVYQAKAIAPPVDYDYIFEDDQDDYNSLIQLLARAIRGGILLFGSSAPFDIDLTLTNAEAAKWATKFATKLIKEIDDATRDVVKMVVSTFISSPGMTIGDAVNMVTPSFSADRAQRIAVTEITRAYAEGQVQAGQEFGAKYPEVKMIKTWFTNADDRVCEICGPLDGQTAEMDEPFGLDVFGSEMQQPPAHPNCRCWISTRSTLGEE